MPVPSRAGSYSGDEMSAFLGGAALRVQLLALLAWRVATSARIRLFWAIAAAKRMRHLRSEVAAGSPRASAEFQYLLVVDMGIIIRITISGGRAVYSIL